VSTHVSRSAILCCATLIIAGCSSPPTARDAWSSGLSRCAENDFFNHRRTLLYLGPSNVFGPGSGWAVEPDGNFRPRWPLQDAILDPELRDALIVPGHEASCHVTAKSTWTIAPELLFAATTLPADASIRAEFSTADHAVVRVSKWRLDTLNEVAYEQWMLSPESGDYAADLLRNRSKRRVMNAAVLVTGFSADLSFSGEQAAKLAAKYPLNAVAALGGGLSVKRTSETTLSIETENPFYVVGTILPFEASGFGMTPSGVTGLLREAPQPIRSEARVLPPEQPTE